MYKRYVMQTILFDTCRYLRKSWIVHSFIESQARVTLDRSIVNRDDSSREVFERLGRHVCVRGRKRSGFEISLLFRHTMWLTNLFPLYHEPNILSTDPCYGISRPKEWLALPVRVIILRFIVSILDEIRIFTKQIFSMIFWECRR